MASGKSAVAAALGPRLGLPVVDLDALVVAREGRSIPELFAERGEAGFRAAEARALAAVAQGAPSVVATGGGAPLAAANVAQMRAAGVTVWLDTAIEVCIARIEADGIDGRPLAAGPDRAARRARLAGTHASRLGHYTAAADLRVDPDGEDPQATAARIASLIVRGGREEAR
jgi:shikimate kinase